MAKRDKPNSELMDKLLFLPGLIIRMESGLYLRPLFAWFFRAIAVVMALTVLYLTYAIIRLVIDHFAFSSLLIGVLAIAAMLFLSSVVIGILWIRSNEIMELNLGKTYPMMSLLSVVIKIFAEFAAVSLILYGTVMTLFFFLLIAAAAAFPVIAPFAVFAPLYLPYIVFGILGGFVFLVAGYSAREFFSLLIRIEINTRKSRSALPLD